MKFEILLLPTDEFKSDEVIEDPPPEKYMLNELGESIFAETIFNKRDDIQHLIDFLFAGRQIVTEIYRGPYAYVLDLSDSKEFIIDFDYLENNYSVWIGKTGRPNTMDEYGMLIGFIGAAMKGANKKYLLMIVSNSRYTK